LASETAKPSLSTKPSACVNSLQITSNAPVALATPQQLTHLRRFNPTFRRYRTASRGLFTMGNICGKEKHDPFAQPGRTLSSAPPPSNTQTSPLPPKVRVGGPPQTLGGSPGKTTTTAAQEDARRKAAEAAEVGGGPRFAPAHIQEGGSG
jgi:hypothetical protein